jgi:hypothetical protein
MLAFASGELMFPDATSYVFESVLFVKLMGHILDFLVFLVQFFLKH